MEECRGWGVGGQLTMYHSSKELSEGGATVKEQGSLAVSPFSASTLGGTVTVTVAPPSGETQR